MKQFSGNSSEKGITVVYTWRTNVWTRTAVLSVERKETVNITQVEVCSPRDIINLSFKG